MSDESEAKEILAKYGEESPEAEWAENARIFSNISGPRWPEAIIALDAVTKLEQKEPHVETSPDFAAHREMRDAAWSFVNDRIMALERQYWLESPAATKDRLRFGFLTRDMVNRWDSSLRALRTFERECPRETLDTTKGVPPGLVAILSDLLSPTIERAFVGANLRAAQCRGQDLHDGHLSRADLRDADLRDTNLRGAFLDGADLRDAKLRCASLRRADLRGAKMARGDLRNADLAGADLTGADLRRADLRDTNLRGAFLDGADLRDAKLRCADLYRADLRRAKLCYADLRDADLAGADLTETDLTGADLRRSSVSFAKFIAATLVAAKFAGTYKLAVFRGADMTGAHVADAWFCDVAAETRCDFTGAKTTVDLRGAHFDVPADAATAEAAVNNEG